MKNFQLKKAILFFSLTFLLTNAVFSQDENNEWAVSLGFNVVDIRTEENISGIFKDYFIGNTEDLNMSGAFLRVSAGKYLKKGLTLQISASMNTIKKGFNYQKGDPLINESFFAFDTKVKYDLNRLIGETKWFDPFVLVGGGYSKIGDTSNFDIAAGWGFNAWFSDTVGLNFQSDYNHHLQSTATDYFQHSIGVIYKLNIRKNFNWSKGL